MTPLAKIRKGRHFSFMRHRLSRLLGFLSIAALLGGLSALPVNAQLLPETPPDAPETQDLPQLPDAAPAPQIESDIQAPEGALTEGMENTRPDIIITSEAEREEKLAALFDKLKSTEDADDANLVAEEIWAIWLRSGSASIDYLLARGAASQKGGDLDLAGRMFDHVVRLEPDYAEGWVRSGRLALEQGLLARAASDCLQGLAYEPRHFYAWWTLGNIFEQLGQRDAAFEAYKEANSLYPALKAVSDRIDYLSDQVEGESL